MNKQVVKLFIILTILSFSFPLNTEAHASEKEYLSEDVVAYTEEIGELYDICPELLQAIIEKESRGNEEAFNGNCVGLMQIYQNYHKDRIRRLNVDDLFDPYSNIMVGADYLVELFEKYEDLYLVLMVYNMGDKKALELYSQDRYSQYAVSICERSAELEKIHGRQ